MIFFDRAATAQHLPYPDLRDGLAAAIQLDAIRTSDRLIQKIDSERLLGLMPAFESGRWICIKAVLLVRSNSDRNLPTHQGQVLLFDFETGVTRAILDATELTLRRTAAASSLAASFLARRDASRYALLGCGSLALPMVEAMAGVRHLEEICVWGRSFEKATQFCDELQRRFPRFRVNAFDDAAEAVARADIVSTITSSSTPVLEGRWLADGTHVDLVGSHSPTTRECDEVAVQRARVFCDFGASAMQEAGDVLIPLRAGAITREHLLGDLADLLRGSVAGRKSERDITLFKSVGNALEDLTAAQLAFRNFCSTSRNADVAQCDPA